MSASSSGTIDKYGYLTGEEILSSNQKKIIEQTKLIYSPLGKLLKKKLKKSKVKEKIKLNQLVHDYDYKDKLLISKEQEIFKNIYNKRIDKIKELTEKMYDNNLVFATISTDKITNFSKKNNPLTFLNKIKKGEITMEEGKELQKD